MNSVRTAGLLPAPAAMLRNGRRCWSGENCGGLRPALYTLRSEKTGVLAISAIDAGRRGDIAAARLSA